MDWVKLSSTYYQDAKVVGLSSEARLLFIDSICLSGSLETFGALTWGQMSTLVKSTRKLKRLIGELLDNGLLSLADVSGSFDESLAQVSQSLGEVYPKFDQSFLGGGKL